MTPGARYGEEKDLPEPVRAALRVATELGFQNSCHPGYGRLLRTFAARGGRILETGTGCGVGTAWMLSALPAGASLVTVEIDSALADAARRLFFHDRRVRVIEGEARAALALGPFDLIFNDGGLSSEDDFETMVKALVAGGVAIKDDLRWGEPASTDPRKALWLGHPDLAAVEVMVAPPDWAAIIATRIR